MSQDTIPIRRTTPNIPEAVVRAATDRLQPKEEIKYPTEVIPLPTKGYFYTEGNPLSSGEVEVKQMTAREEDILSNQELVRKGKFLDKLLESLIVNKTIKVDEILIPDKDAILIGVRRLAYGDEYPISLKCPSCRKDNKISINLGEIKERPFNFELVSKGSNSFDFKLPNSGKTITYKLLNQTDQNSITAELENLKRNTKDEVSKEMTTRLKYLITSIDGNPDKSLIRKFIDEQLTAMDSLAFRKHIRETQPGIDSTFYFKCGFCDFERRTEIPLGMSFLWPDFES